TTSHHVILKQHYNTTGAWSSFTVSSKTPIVGNNVHDHGSIYRDPVSVYIWALYGSTAAIAICSSDITQCRGPFARRTTNADDITAWQPEVRLPVQGFLNETNGGFDASGNLHLVSQHGDQVGSGSANFSSYDLA